MNTIIAMEILNEFKFPANVGHEYAKFGYDNGYLYATNGHICIRLEAAPYVVGDGTYSYQDAIERVLSGITDSTKFEPLIIPDLPPKIDCRGCAGSGAVGRCGACDGRGEMKKKNHRWYECAKCEGSGVSATSKDAFDASPCWMCDGSGESLHNPVKLSHTYFNRRYLSTLSRLDGIEIALAENALGVHFFRFKYGVGAVMATKP
jgi:hypothetical protein